MSNEQVQSLDNYDSSNVYNDLEKLVLRFAEQWTRQSKVDEATMTALTQKLSPTQLVVLAATVGLANWTNRFNESFGVQLP